MADGALEDRHLSPGMRKQVHRGEGVRSAELLPDGSIEGSKLAAGSVGPQHPQPDSNPDRQLAAGRQVDRPLSPGSIQHAHLSEELRRADLLPAGRIQVSQRADGEAVGPHRPPGRRQQRA
ncbi:hypothetical protein AMQ84_00020, partial [Paenibacillus riograndensis]